MLKIGYQLIKEGNKDWIKICKERGLSETAIDYLSLFDTTQTREESIRKKQKKFRENVSNYWNHQCAITCVDEYECDACHIYPVELGGTYDTDNGILLSKSLHSSFDKGAWTIMSNDGKIVKIDEKKSTIDPYVGQKIEISLGMSDYLSWHNYYCYNKK